MDRWVGKVAVVTGASAGVGASVVVQLAKNGMIVVAVARRLEKIQKLQEELVGARGSLVPLQGDVSKEEDIVTIFNYVRKNYGKMHLLINNAGFMKAGKIIEGSPEVWKSILDVNVLGLASCSEKAVKLMRETGINDGQIININSLAGHRIPPSPNPMFNIYPPSKFAVTAISETLRQELASVKSKIRVTNLSPGYIKTEFQDVAIDGNEETKKLFETFLATRPALTANDVTETVIFILSTPAHVQIHELMLGAV